VKAATFALTVYITLPRTVENAPQTKNTVRTIALKQPLAAIAYPDPLASNCRPAKARAAAVHRPHLRMDRKLGREEKPQTVLAPHVLGYDLDSVTALVVSD
jgi:hypothetical protein